MDQYCKDKKREIKDIRAWIRFKYESTFPIILFILLFVFIIAIDQPPSRWTQKEVVYTGITHEYSYRSSKDVLNTEDGGRFIIKSRFASADDLRAKLVPGKSYTLVYSDMIGRFDHMEALSDEKNVFQDLDKSISVWKREQKEYFWAIGVLLVLEVIALILVDRLWCKKEYAQIRELKADIKEHKKSGGE